MKRYAKIVLTLLTLLLAACDTHPVFVSSVPSYPVQFQLNIWGEYNSFVPDNGFQTLRFTQRRYDVDYIGYAGLLIWVDMGSEYHAADLCCPHCLDQQAPVEINGIYAVCPKCHEEYDLSFGTAHPTKGISSEMLRRYTVSYSNGKLFVSP